MKGTKILNPTLFQSPLRTTATTGTKDSPPSSDSLTLNTRLSSSLLSLSFSSDRGSLIDQGERDSGTEDSERNECIQFSRVKQISIKFILNSEQRT